MNPAEALWNSHEPLRYPNGVKRIPIPIVGTSFFPGGYGLWNPEALRPLPDFPVGGVMVLGHDFHSEAGYLESLERGFESPTQPTWAALLKLLRQAEIEPEECFFTNIYMGLRAGTATTGPFPGRLDKDFVDHCKRFLIKQLDRQRPRLILTLGAWVPHFLSDLSPQLDAWASHRGFGHIDKVGALQTGVSFRGLPRYATTIVALTHPSLRGPNLRHRKYKGLSKEAAELEMLKDARRG